jgi:hypothetical protein
MSADAGPELCVLIEKSRCIPTDTAAKVQAATPKQDKTFPETRKVLLTSASC